MLKKWYVHVLGLTVFVILAACDPLGLTPSADLVDGRDEVPAGAVMLQRADGNTAVLIAFDRVPGPAEEALVRGVGGTIRYTYHLVPAIAATIPEQALDGLRRNPNVTAIDLDGQVQAVDAELDNTWGVQRIGAGTVHLGGNKGAGVKVAVIDTGIDYTHPDLDDNYAGGYDFVNNDADPMDDAGHGTHVAGTVAAEDDDSGVVGVAPEAALYALKVLDANGSGAWSGIIAALEWAVDNGIQVANLSLGSSADPGGMVREAFDNAEAAGVVIVASAGNSGNPPGKGNNVLYPARFDSVIAVAATDSQDRRASFSSTGPAVELAAPGVGINSTILGGGYSGATWNGTSMASPHVAGAAALVIAAGIADVRSQLQVTAGDLGTAGRDSQYGFGLVGVVEAVGTLPPPSNDPPAVLITSPADGATFGSGAIILFEGTATDTEDGVLTGNLAWISSIDGVIGTGGTLLIVLGDGSHTVTASATDAGGKTGSASVQITVGTATLPGSVSVASIEYSTSGGRNQDKHLSVTAALVDDLGSPVDGASVSIRLDNAASGDSWTGGGTTGSEGNVTFTLSNAPAGSYTTIVANLAAPGLIWDGVTPGNEFVK